MQYQSALQESLSKALHHHTTTKGLLSKIIISELYLAK